MGFAEAEWLRRNAACGVPAKDSSFSVYRNSDFSASILLDASDLVIEEQLIGIVRSVSVVRNTTSPKNRFDGDIVVSLGRSEMHKYASVPFKDMNVPKDKTVCYALFVESEGNVVIKTKEILLSEAGIPSAMTLMKAVPSTGGYVSLYMDIPDSVPAPNGGYIETDGYVVRRGSSGFPETSDDGSFIASISKENLHRYAETPFIDGSTFAGNTYYYRAFPVTNYGSENLSEENCVSVTAGTAPKEPEKFFAKNYSDSSSGSIRFVCQLSDKYVKNNEDMVLTEMDRLVIRARTDQYPAGPDDGQSCCSVEISGETNVDTLWTCSKGTTYYLKLFIHSVDGIWASFDSCQAVIETRPCVYGFMVRHSESSPKDRVSYVDDAIGMEPMHMDYENDIMDYGSWKNSWILRSFRPVMLSSSGTVDYELDPSDQTKKLDGTPSEIFSAEYDGNAMVEAKTIYMKTWNESTFAYVQFADYKKDEGFRPIAHEADDGGILETVYFPMFEGSKVSSVLRSIGGKATATDITKADADALAEANGSDWQVDSSVNWKLIEHLLYLLAKSTDSEEAFGNGHITGGTKKGDLLETGTLADKGMFYGTNDESHAVKVFWMENYYGNRWDMMGDIDLENSEFSVRGNTVSAEISGTSGGCQSAHIMTEFGMFPSAANGSESTFVPDAVWFVNSPSVQYAVYKGGDCKSGKSAGISAIDISHETTFTSWSAGASICYRRSIS